MRWFGPNRSGSRRARSAPFAIAVVVLSACLATGCRRAPPVAPAPTRAPLRTVAYQVQPGDTDTRIAAWHGVPVDALRRLNDLDADERLDPGRTLLVPARPLPTYRVESGDTVGRLAQSFGVELAALAHLNGIADPRRLAAGTVLRIPATASRTAVPRTAQPERNARPPETTPPVAASPVAAAAPVASPATRQADEALASAQHAFEQAQFEEALAWTDRAQQALPASSTNDDDQQRLAQANLVRGMTEIALGRDADARASFARALALDGSIELDPARVSPKVLTVFREVRGR